MKKLSAMLLAIAMCMALAIPAFADNEETPTIPTNRATTYTIDVEQPVINVTVPTAATVKLNPYQIAVQMTGMTTSSTGSILAGKMYLTNKSNVPLNMSLVATGSIPKGSNATFATTAPESTEKNRKVFMFIDVSDPVEEATPTTSALSSVTYSSDNKKQGVIKAGDLKMTDIMQIGVPTNSTTGNYVTVQIGGECASTPTEAWTSADKVGLSIAFTFVATKNDTTVNTGGDTNDNTGGDTNNNTGGETTGDGG